METNERICCICGASVGNGTGRVSKFKGDGKCWRCYIKKDGVPLIEWYDTEEEAIKNRLLHEIKVYGKIVSSENKKYEYLINHSPAEGEA